MSSDLSSVLGATIASLIQIGESKSPEEAGQRLEESMSHLQSLKADTPMKKLLVELGNTISGVAKSFNDVTVQLHTSTSTPQAQKLYNDFMADPNIFLSSIPNEFKFDAAVCHNLASAYELRSYIQRNKEGVDNKLLGMLSSREILTLTLQQIQKMWLVPSEGNSD